MSRWTLSADGNGGFTIERRGPRETELLEVSDTGIVEYIKLRDCKVIERYQIA